MYKSQISSSLIYRRETTSLSEINFIIQVAWQYAQDGLSVCILSKKFDDQSDINFTPFLSNPEILQRIVFRYFVDSTEIIEWCHEMHKRSRIPQLFLLSGLETFSPTNDFTAVEICAALLDAVQYCSHFSKKCTHLLVTVSDNCPNHLFSFFDQAWYLESIQADNTLVFSKRYPSFPCNSFEKLNMKIQ